MNSLIRDSSAVPSAPLPSNSPQMATTPVIATEAIAVLSICAARSSARSSSSTHFALRGCLDNTTIARRGGSTESLRRCSGQFTPDVFSPGFAHARQNPLRGVRPSSRQGSTLPPKSERPTTAFRRPAASPRLPRTLITLGRLQTGRDAAPTVLNPSVSRGPNRLHVRVLPGRGGVGALLAPASHPRRRSRSCPPRSAARFAGAA